MNGVCPRCGSTDPATRLVYHHRLGRWIRAEETLDTVMPCSDPWHDRSVDVSASRALVSFGGDVLEYMDFTPHPMTPRMVWRSRRRFGRSWPRAMWQAFRGRGPWTEVITEHEERQIEDYLKQKWGIE